MKFRWRPRAASVCLIISLLLLPCACQREYIPFLGPQSWVSGAGGGSVFGLGAPAFSESLIQSRTFLNGTAVTTVTYAVGDTARTPLGIDFNSDGKIDPVVGYGNDQAVIQILLSTGGTGTANYISLTMDSKRDMENLADVAVGDIDGDGRLDIVGAAEGSCWYFHHPSDAPTTELSEWGNLDPNDELRERIDASYIVLTDDEMQAMINQALGPGVNLDDYIVTVSQLYPNIEVADMDNDGHLDVIASRSFNITLSPKPDVPVEPLMIVDGDVMVFLNPDGAADGHNWSGLSIGSHERQTRLDRDGATGLLAYDLDGDGDLDIISSARDDNNVQVAWFENPGAPLNANDTWQQWRIGSIRDTWSLDVGDITGDGRPDVVAAGGEQMQMLLFTQPADGPKRSYDWDTTVIANFESIEPRDVKLLDVDRDAVLEVVVSGSAGAVRYLEQPTTADANWTVQNVLDFNPPGEVGYLGFGDLDGDGDLDLVCVIGTKDITARVSWVRNDLINLNPLGS